MADRLITGTAGNDVIPAHGGLVIVASASIGQFNIWPHVNVLVNGNLVGSADITANVFAGASQAIVAPLPAGTQVNSVTIAYTNDEQTDFSLDRNIFLSSVSVNGTPLTLSSGSYFRDLLGPAPAGYSNTDLNWGGTLTFSGAAVQAAGAAVPAGTVEINGGAGLDTAVYTGARASHSFVRQADGSYLIGTGGAPDTMVNVERVVFSDAKVALDINGAGGMAYRLYQAAFDRAPDLGGLGYWINVLDTGATLGQVSQGFLGSPEFTTLYGANPTTEQYVTLLYQNVLHRAPDAGGFNYWVGNLNASALTRADTLAQFSESAENQAALIGVIQHGMTFV